MYLLQDWTTIGGNGTSPVVQSVLDWADFARFADAVFWLEVRSVANPGAGSVTLSYETAPARDNSLFQPLATVTLVAGTSPVVTKARIADNPTVPLARWLRWKLQGTASGNWSACFRIFATGGKASSAFNPGGLALTGWWQASYTGSPWTAASGTPGGAVSCAAPPAVGTAVNGFTPANMTALTQYLRSSGTNYLEKYVSLSGSVSSPPGPGYSQWCLFYARTAQADDASFPYNNPGLLSTNAGGYFGLGFSTAGVRVFCYDGAYHQLSVACTTGTWHLVQVVHDGTNLKALVDSGALSSVAAGLPITPGDNTYFLQLCNSYTFANAVDGMVLEAGFSKTIFTDSDRANIKSYVNARYGLSL